MWKHSIKTKLILSFSLIILAAIVVSGASMLMGARRTIEKEIQNELVLLADAKEGQVFAYLDSLESRTLDFSSGVVRDSLTEIDKNNSAQVVERLNTHLIKDKKPLDSNLIDIDVLDKNGVVIASTNPQEIGRDKREDACFLEGKKKVATINAEKNEYPNVSGAILEVAAPLINENTNEFLGVIVNIFKTEKLDAILSGDFQIQKGALSSQKGIVQTLEIHLVDKEKKVIAHGHKETGNMVDTIDTLPVQKYLSDNEEIVGSYSNNLGVEVIGASMGFPGRGWVLLTEINTEEAFAPIWNMTYELVIMLVLVLLLVIFDILLIAAKIVDPIKKLREATDILAQGNLDYKVDIKTGDETEQLANDFNTMAASIQKSYAELEEFSKGLEEKVAEKTKDLQNKVDDLSKTRKAILNVAEDAEREKQETAREKNKIDSILHSIGDGVFVVDKDLKVILVNNIAAKISGYAVEEILGAKYIDKLKFVYEKTQKINDKFVIRAIETKTIQEMSNHTVLVNKVGNQIPVSDSAAPLLDKDGKVIGCVVVFRDVTKEREIDRLKDEFVSIASHELRTPLTAIDGLVSMILDGEYGAVNKNLKQPLEDVNTSSERLINLVNDMLNLSRIKAGRMKYMLSDFPISDIIVETVQLLQPVAKPKNIELVAAENLEKIDVQGDVDKVKQALNNLIGNSLKFTDKGSITVSTKAVGDKVEIYITDTGIGIAKEDQDKLFGQFQQLESGRGRPTGTGLGLYISKEIAQKMGGDLWLKNSEKGVGSTFAFSLPKAKSKLAEQVKITIEAEAKEKTDQKSS